MYVRNQTKGGKRRRVPVLGCLSRAAVTGSRGYWCRAPTTQKRKTKLQLLRAFLLTADFDLGLPPEGFLGAIFGAVPTFALDLASTFLSV
jgi:hypothetical protein